MGVVFSLLVIQVSFGHGLSLLCVLPINSSFTCKKCFLLGSMESQGSTDNVTFF